MAEPVILTGATGFVGRAVLAELVARGIPVHAVSRNGGPAMRGVVWHRADLLTPQGRQMVAGLAPQMVHCAWYVAHGAFWHAPANADWHAASRDLVQQFLVCGGQRVLITGTCAEYDAGSPAPFAETATIAPDLPYGQAKAALHHDLAAIGADHLVWARLFHLFGPGEDRRRLVPSLIDAYRAGHQPDVRGASLVRDYASTGYVATCLVDLLQSRATGAFNIGSGTVQTLGDLALQIAAAVGPDCRPVLHMAPVPDQPAVITPDLRKLRATIARDGENLQAAIAQLVRNDPQSVK